MSHGLQAPLPRRSLLWRLFSVNAALVMIGTLVLVIAPVTVRWPPSALETLLIVVGLVAVLVADLALMRRGLRPLGRLRVAMVSVDPLAPGPRADVGARSTDVADLNRAFNAMLDRLESERRDSARRTQAAQEAERRWLSLELHDQIGQSLTALLLQLDVASRGLNGDAEHAALDLAKETARDCLNRIRGLAKHLRPEALDDLGLRSALMRLCERLTATTGLDVHATFAPDVPTLSSDTQLVVYRIAQESLTNVVRHANAATAEVSLSAVENGVRLTVRDDGRGGVIDEGSGVTGMRERALMVGSRLSISQSPYGGIEVRLDVPPSEVAA